ncbi:MAG: hypothetical protein K6T90_17020 [Leptolyngbyaceae cyanobacterium HOT.MB2.61]|nr:hypothetical protein [Leptolyngbyaceae cyanobacterium HOT.MB2.61]
MSKYLCRRAMRGSERFYPKPEFGRLKLWTIEAQYHKLRSPSLNQALHPV